MSIQDNDRQANIPPKTHKICRIFRQVTISESHFFPQKKNGVEMGKHSCIYMSCLTNNKLANTGETKWWQNRQTCPEPCPGTDRTSN